MTKVLFFGKLSEALGARGIELSAQSNVSINDIIKAIAAAQKDEWLDLLNANTVITAVNKTIENDRDKTLEDVTEIAFFPPVTGG